jgi:predicted TIM-barrel fold metal-dependent hydrolase
MKQAGSTSVMTRRDFVGAAGLALAAGILGHEDGVRGAEPIIDIHQHLGYSGRPDPVLLMHQRALGATTTILLPAGRSVRTPSTHDGVSNGLQAECLGNEPCRQFAKAHSNTFRFGANEVPDVEGATREIERYLKLGGLLIAEQKFGVECDSAEMQRIFEVAQAHHVPVLMHWQFQMYNYGLERFYKMLEKFPRVNFFGHAQTWWGHIDKNHTDQTVMYPKGPVTRGGLTDRYLSDYPNMFGDLSAGSGLNALTRDEEFAKDFISRHQDKLIYGSDCNDLDGTQCQGAQTIAAIRRMAPSKAVERKLLYGNAKRLFRL